MKIFTLIILAQIAIVLHGDICFEKKQFPMHFFPQINDQQTQITQIQVLQDSGSILFGGYYEYRSQAYKFPFLGYYYSSTNRNRLKWFQIYYALDTNSNSLIAEVYSFDVKQYKIAIIFTNINDQTNVFALLHLNDGTVISALTFQNTYYDVLLQQVVIGEQDFIYMIQFDQAQNSIIKLESDLSRVLWSVYIQLANNLQLEPKSIIFQDSEIIIAGILAAPNNKAYSANIKLSTSGAISSQIDYEVGGTWNEKNGLETFYQYADTNNDLLIGCMQKTEVFYFAVNAFGFYILQLSTLGLKISQFASSATSAFICNGIFTTSTHIEIFFYFIQSYSLFRIQIPIQTLSAPATYINTGLQFTYRSGYHLYSRRIFQYQTGFFLGGQIESSTKFHATLIAYDLPNNFFVSKQGVFPYSDCSDRIALEFVVNSVSSQQEISRFLLTGVAPINLILTKQNSFEYVVGEDPITFILLLPILSEPTCLLQTEYKLSSQKNDFSNFIEFDQQNLCFKIYNSANNSQLEYKTYLMQLTIKAQVNAYTTQTIILAQQANFKIRLKRNIQLQQAPKFEKNLESNQIFTGQKYIYQLPRVIYEQDEQYLIAYESLIQAENFTQFDLGKFEFYPLLDSDAGIYLYQVMVFLIDDPDFSSTFTFNLEVKARNINGINQLLYSIQDYQKITESPENLKAKIKMIDQLGSIQIKFEKQILKYENISLFIQDYLHINLISQISQKAIKLDYNMISFFADELHLQLLFTNIDRETISKSNVIQYIVKLNLD
ncbi:UNKNOWN [Stylonychia lemnae]|uniref:Uncharacterized protein n=1 Tax=Stylonychia lemnae TaxID=5949 RepID=A0A077ZZJ8_STYLE|nr:UNKNOWN [Stylonychia lemnae]|eukprot:CDW75346.1 UNKNOWN [Stylonychia lemnae]